MEAKETREPESGDPGVGCGSIPRPPAYPNDPGRTSECRPVSGPLEVALRDLAEYGWTHVPTRALAERIARAAEQPGRAVVIEALGGGWYSVEIEDRPPRGAAREG